MRLGSGIAVAMAQVSSYTSDSTCSLGTFVCRRCGPKKTKKKKKKRIEIFFFFKFLCISFQMATQLLGHKYL